MARNDEYTFDTDRQRKRIGAKRDLDGNLVKQENIPIGGAPRERTDFTSALQPRLGAEVESSASRAKRQVVQPVGPRSGETMGPPSPQSFTRMGGEIAGPSQNGQPLGEINAMKIDPKYRVPGGPSVGTATFAPTAPRTAYIGDETGDRTKEFVRPQPQMIAPAVQPAAPVAKATPVATPAAVRPVVTPQAAPAAVAPTPAPQTPSFLDRGKEMAGNAAQSFSNFAGQAKSAIVGGATAAAATAIPKVQSFIRDPQGAMIGQFNENTEDLQGMAKSGLQFVDKAREMAKDATVKGANATIQGNQAVKSAGQSFIRERGLGSARILNDMRERVAGVMQPANPLPAIRSFANSLIGPKTKEAMAQKKRPKTAITGKGTTAPHKKMAGAY